jgi:hypothetical protein
MATMLKNAQQRAAMTAKEERARDAALAMREYQAEKLAVRAKTARLRALRLAKETENRQHTNKKEAATRVANLLRRNTDSASVHDGIVAQHDGASLADCVLVATKGETGPA